MKKISLIIVAIIIILSGCSVNIPTETPNCDIKGNINSQGDKVYHLKECAKYDEININPNGGEKWFCSVEEAEKEGWIKSKNCP